MLKHRMLLRTFPHMFSTAETLPELMWMQPKAFTPTFTSVTKGLNRPAGLHETPIPQPAIPTPLPQEVSLCLILRMAVGNSS